MREPQRALADFRAALMAKTGSPACHLVSSGRAALTVILLGLRRLRNRSKVVVPAYSCPTVVQSVLEAGLEPVLCDVSPRTLDFDRSALSHLVSHELLAIVPVHLYGLAQDVGDLMALGREHGFYVVEDAAQAFGATFGGRMVGTRGDAGLYSLGRGKCIPVGHGGVVVSQDRCAAAISEVMETKVARPARVEHLREGAGALALFSGYGLATRPTGWWFVVRTPMNPADDGMDVESLPPIQLRGLPAAQAGIGASILGRLDEIQAVWRGNARLLMDRLAEFDFMTLPTIPPGADPVFLRLPIVVDQVARAEALFELLWQQGIGVSRSYVRTLADLYSDRLPVSGDQFPGATKLASCLLTLPTHTYLMAEDIDRAYAVFRSIES